MFARACLKSLLMKILFKHITLLLVLLMGLVNAWAEIADLDDEMLVLQQACPARWEQLNVMINPEQVEEGNIWEDETDFLAWQTHLTSLAQAQNLTGEDIIRMSQDELTVVTECMAQRVKVMLLLGGTPLGESGLTYLNDSEVIQQQPSNNNDDNLLIGSISTYPAESCKQIKEMAPQAESGFYWIQLVSLDLLNTYRVFCEMEHAGGGWMYWGHIGKSANNSSLFEQLHEGYDVTRIKTYDFSAVNNVFPISQFADTEMIFTIDTSDFVEAKVLNKYVHYKYAVDSPMFNNGPLPCQASAFEYSLDGINFHSGTSACSNLEWYPKTYSGAYLSLIYQSGGVYWGSGMGGNNSWSHSAWIYIR